MKFFITIENLANFNFHFWILQDGWTVKSLLNTDCNCLESKFEYVWKTDWSISLFWRDRIRLLIVQSSMQSMKTYTISHDRKNFISSLIVQLNINDNAKIMQKTTRTGIWPRPMTTRKWTVQKVDGLVPNYRRPSTFNLLDRAVSHMTVHFQSFGPSNLTGVPYPIFLFKILVWPFLIESLRQVRKILIHH